MGCKGGDFVCVGEAIYEGGLSIRGDYTRRLYAWSGRRGGGWGGTIHGALRY